MHSVTVTILLGNVLIAQANLLASKLVSKSVDHGSVDKLVNDVSKSVDHGSMDKLVDDLVHKSVNKLVDHITLAKPGRLSFPPRTHLRPHLQLRTHPQFALSSMAGVRLMQHVVPRTVAKASQIEPGRLPNAIWKVAAQRGLREAVVSTGLLAATFFTDKALKASGMLPADVLATAMFSAGIIAIITAALLDGGSRTKLEVESRSELKKQLAIARGDASLMGPISKQPSLQPTPPGALASSALRDQGVVRLNRVLSVESASAVRKMVIQQLATVLSEQNSNKEVKHPKLGIINCRVSRYDLLLKLDGGVLEAAVREALNGPLGAMMEDVVGLEAPFAELGAIVSEKGAPSQPIHPDTWYDDGHFYTIFIALQDVSLEMGPTLFLPGTHTKTAEEQALKMGYESRASLLQRTPFVTSTLSKGDCSVYDSRVLHGGGENTEGTRAMLYFTFGYPGTNMSAVTANKFPGEHQEFFNCHQENYRLADFRPKVQKSSPQDQRVLTVR